MLKYLVKLKGGGGGGGGGFRTPGAHRCLRDSHAHIWSIFGSILPNHLTCSKPYFWNALLVATSLLKTCIIFIVLSKLAKL